MPPTPSRRSSRYLPRSTDPSRAFAFEVSCSSADVMAPALVQGRAYIILRHQDTSRVRLACVARREASAPRVAGRRAAAVAARLAVRRAIHASVSEVSALGVRGLHHARAAVAAAVEAVEDVA